MPARQRAVAIALGSLLAAGLVAFAIDVTTIRIPADAPILRPVTYTAFPGELIRVEIDAAQHEVRSSDASVVAPQGGNWFTAARPGEATLSAVFGPPPGVYYATLLWHVNVEVRLPGL